MGSVSQLTALLLLGVGVTAGESQRTQEERNTIAVFSKARLGVVHIKASQQESTDFGPERSFEGIVSSAAFTARSWGRRWSSELPFFRRTLRSIQVVAGARC